MIQPRVCRLEVLGLVEVCLSRFPLTTLQYPLSVSCEPRWWIPHRKVLVRSFHSSAFHLNHAKLVRLCDRSRSKCTECYSPRMEVALASRYPPFSDKKSKRVERLSSPSFPPRDSVYKPRGWGKKWVVALLTLGVSLWWAQRKRLIAN